MNELLRSRHQAVEPDPTPAFQPRSRLDWMEFFSERAAMFEYLGGHDRAVAEQLAGELAGEAP